MRQLPRPGLFIQLAGKHARLVMGKGPQHGQAAGGGKGRGQERLHRLDGRLVRTVVGIVRLHVLPKLIVELTGFLDAKPGGEELGSQGQGLRVGGA